MPIPPPAENNPAGPTERLHALDSFRSCMMLLGILLHTLFLYLDFPAGRIPDSQTSSAFDFAYIFLHLFRMPAFFMISGFFAILLLERRGPKQFIANRAGRIGAPFAIGWLPLFSLTLMSIAFALRQAHAQLVIPDEKFSFGVFVRDQGLVHLWFLYYLLFYYTFIVVAFYLWRTVPVRVSATLRSLFERFAPSAVGYALLSVFTFPALLHMRFGILQTSPSFVPNPWVLYVYALFFFFGAGLYKQRGLLSVFQRGAGTRCFLGLALVPVNFLSVQFEVSHPFSGAFPAKAGAAASGAIIAWLFVTGFMGLFLKYANRPNVYVRYLNDSAYWLYLTHLPLVNYIGGLLVRTNLAIWLRASLTLVIATPILLLTYHVLVRSTLIGKTLNGRIYPFSLPGEQTRDTLLHRTNA